MAMPAADAAVYLSNQMASASEDFFDGHAEAQADFEQRQTGAL